LLLFSNQIVVAYEDIIPAIAVEMILYL